MNNPLIYIDPLGLDTVSVNRGAYDYYRSDEGLNVWEVTFSYISNGEESAILDENGEEVKMFMISNTTSDEKGDNYLNDDTYTLKFQTRGKKLDEKGNPKKGYENEIYIVDSPGRGEFIHPGTSYYSFDGCKGLCTDYTVSKDRTSFAAATSKKNSIEALSTVRSIYNEHQDNLTGEKFILKTNTPSSSK